ncbi:thiamine-phosphate kinase [Alkalihalobacterium chitinilyticum]|uniref:Thiamine-monophosphate kinase n=1 Tax=Alkalihalobacterium chitinilyticum TaxID=2980103 RepID=A0ABT5VL54_9BACI|nr:thiamine-phosphate kinase [Alkalihalobacterium chitinilyticum]MDE5416186.1 thiamine-phosphate kinase [Alkalihalobacterium chitinilyticum]
MQDEFSFITKITPKQVKQRELIHGIGDDAALFHIEGAYDEVICVDTMVEDIHFRKDTMAPFHIGHKALAVNISDIAAMGGTPLFYLVSIAIPKDWEDEELYEIYEGMSKLASQYEMDLIGGDTVSTKDKLVISVTVIGKIEKGRRLLRSQAKSGDLVFVTGNVGSSAAGLHLLFEKTRTGSFSKEEMELIQSHQMPQPQVKAGRVLAQSNCRLALNDVSDGLASEANEIAEASGVTIVIEENKIPIIPVIDAIDPEQRLKWALFGGEDFQLIGTMSEENWEMVHKQLEKQGVTASVIGKVTAGEAKVFLQTEENLVELKKEGYNHFK